jgi:TRAP-type C4-dicarboxylate transport system permease small subunit
VTVDSPTPAALPPSATRLDHWAATARRAASFVSAAMFAVVFVIFIFKIFSRYAEHNEAAWTDELCVVLFIWMIFWANAFVLRDRDQIHFDLLYRPCPPPVRRVLMILRLLLIGGSFLWALPAITDYIMFLWRERTPVLRWRLDLVYSCFGLFVLSVVVRSLWGLGQMLGPNWRRHV